MDHLAKQVAGYVGANFPPAQRIDLVGFSIGGLVAQYYVQRLGGLERVRRFISISSPHRGTWAAWGRWNAGARQMRPGSPFLMDLHRDLHLLENVGFTSIWSALDLMILPATSSVLQVGRSIRLNVAIHAWMVRDARVMRTVADVLEENSAA